VPPHTLTVNASSCLLPLTQHMPQVWVCEGMVMVKQCPAVSAAATVRTWRSEAITGRIPWRWPPLYQHPGCEPSRPGPEHHPGWAMAWPVAHNSQQHSGGTTSNFRRSEASAVFKVAKWRLACLHSRLPW